MERRSFGEGAIGYASAASGSSQISRRTGPPAAQRQQQRWQPKPLRGHGAADGFDGHDFGWRNDRLHPKTIVGRHGPGWTKIDDAITLLDDCMILLSLVSLAILGNRYISGIKKSTSNDKTMFWISNDLSNSSADGVDCDRKPCFMIFQLLESTEGAQGSPCKSLRRPRAPINCLAPCYG